MRSGSGRRDGPSKKATSGPSDPGRFVRGRFECRSFPELNSCIPDPVLPAEGVTVLTQGKIVIELSSQQALVLFELLHRINETEELRFEDQAEQRVLRNVEGVLEKQLVEVISPGYHDYLIEARQAVRDPLDGD